MKKLEEICSANEMLVRNFNAKLAEGMERVNTDEAGKVADMIKDLAEAEEKCWKAMYYQMLCCALMEGEEGSERMGYDNWRYSSGRFAPEGRGHFAGFHFPPMPENLIDQAIIDRMGYGNSGSGGGNSGGSSGGRGSSSGGRGGSYGGSSGGSSSRRGYNYDDYAQARRYYSETSDPNARSEMNEKAREYMGDTMNSIKEIMDDADPELKRKIKGDLANLLGQLS